ncbi:hypothetical protein H9L19_06840 [Weissella diestrammenae]|uniref:Uncharacterized protein n=1 Tax=Weissella diestrammenae TaxID=1162633 RepID=A0A7G9T4Q9_9LACO|nr:hypothetical protein [Weissella diestrammenae]MCM0582795.1 hypothetical protein [Weissella diestrammenae]QNN75084.1 hypothetical protein H9L19_06840 [Weissella diestrammenae]
MLKKIVTFLDIAVDDRGNENEVERKETVRFVYTLRTLKLYEQRTGRRFFSDYNQALQAMSEYFTGFEKVNAEEVSQEQMMQILPLLSDEKINTFLIELLPVLFAETKDGVLVQSEVTADEAENSMWLMSLVNVEMFIEVFQMLSQHQTSKKKTTKSASKK